MTGLGAVPAAGPAGGRRLLAYLALRDRPVPRSQIAGTLWWRSNAARASCNLRAALARLPRPGGTALVRGGTTHLDLAGQVGIDLAGARDRIDAVQHGQASGADGPAEVLCEDLLPSWDEEWVVVERERHRQLRLHALEEMSTSLLAAGRYGEALSARRTAGAAARRP